MSKFLFTSLLVLLFPFSALAQGSGFSTELIEPETSISEEFFKVEVIEVLKDEEIKGQRYTQWDRLFKVKALTGSIQGEEFELEDSGVEGLGRKIPAKVGDVVVVGKVENLGQTIYFLADVYRVPVLWIIGFFFLLVVVAVARWKGLGAILGLGLSVVILVEFMLPQLLKGANPFLIIGGSLLIISCLTIFLAHGFQKRTALALASTLITLGLAAGFSYLAVIMANLSGLGSEEAVFLNIASFKDLNIQGLFLGAVLIGALGVLDDITTAQTAVVDELKKANPSLEFKELVARSLSVGKEHIASLVNTLVLAYAGASLPLLLLLALNETQPLWVILNSEFMAEEIIRALAGSLALVLAVPITTGLAAWYYGRR